MVSSIFCHPQLSCPITASLCHPGTRQQVPGLGGVDRAEMKMVFNSHVGLRTREGRVVKLPGGVLRLNHPYFKANSRSVI